MQTASLCIPVGSPLLRTFQALLWRSSSTSRTTPERTEIQQIIAGELITPHFQPIFSLAEGELYGHEALSRLTRPGAIAGSDELFAKAAELGLAASLEMLCRKKALARVRELGIPGRIFVNVCPNLLASAHQRGITAALLDELGIPRSRITFELTERTMIEDYDLFHRVLAHYREQGYSIAIDDLGSGFAGLKMLAKLEPEYVKLSRFLISGIDTSDTQQALVEALATFCSRIGAKVIAEGIERPEELDCLRACGVSLGQGYLLGRPTPSPFIPGALTYHTTFARP